MYLVLPLFLISRSHNRHAKLAIRIKEIAFVDYSD